MLPGNVISSQLVYAPFIQAQVAKHSVPLVDYELGGVALNDPSGGLDVQLWTLRKVGNDLVVFDAANVGTVVITVPDAIRIALAFDQNMKPMIAYSTPTSSYLYWFDTFLNANTTTEFAGTSFLRLALDERRQVLIQNSDVILAYNVGNSLRYRQQRDRFMTERTLVADMGATRLTAIAMNNVYRLQFKFKGDYVQPPYVPPATDPNYANVVSLLNFDTNLTDAKGLVWTATGQASVGALGLALDGNGDYITTPDNATLEFDSGDFTVEAFIQLPTLTGAGQYPAIIAKQDGDTTTASWLLYLNQNNVGAVASFSANGSSLTYAAVGGALVANTMQHVAFMRSGNNVRVSLNGTVGAPSAFASAIFNGSASMIIGRHGVSQGGNDLNGYVRAIRVTKGVARYTANFTPPSFPFPEL